MIQSNINDPNIAAILAQLGVDNPSTADRTTIMNYLKLLEDQIGPDTAAAGGDSVMAFCKAIYDRAMAIPVNGKWFTTASETMQVGGGSEVSVASSWYSLISKFTPMYDGNARFKFQYRATVNNYVGTVAALTGRRPEVTHPYKYGTYASSISTWSKQYYKNLGALAIGANIDPTGLWSDSTVVGVNNLKDFPAVEIPTTVAGTYYGTLDIPVRAGETVYFIGATNTGNTSYLAPWGVYYTLNGAVALNL